MKIKLAMIILVCTVIFNGCSDANQANKKTTVTNTKNSEETIVVKNVDQPQVNSFKKKGQGVPVLMYHSIAWEKGNPVRLPKEKFKEQMQYLKDNNYITLSLSELYRYLVEDTPIPEKSVVLTFDDGYEDNYKEAYQILKEYGFKATIFVITSLVDKESAYLTSTQLKEMEKNGIDIESHTINHDNLKDLNYQKQVSTLKGSKEFLEKLLGKEIKYIAYPFGGYNKDTLKAVNDAGYSMAFTTDGRWSDKEDGILKLDRVYISGFFNLDVFKERISNPEYKFTN